MPGEVRRELRVAFSPRAQPVWFRVIKWVLIICAIILLRQKPFFWTMTGVALILALSLHFFYRWKTRAWTKPWGGWNDVQPPP